MEALLIALVAGLAIAVMVWHLRRGQTVLERWAKANELRLLDYERRYLRRGPFFWRTNRGQEVFYVTVRDRQGQVHHAYVRCGSWWLGLISDAAVAEWVD